MATQYRNAIGPTIDVTNVGNSALSGGGQGAMAGASFGPVGVIVGAVVGTIGGLITGSQQRRAQEAAIAAQLSAAAKANDANLMALSGTLSDLSRQRAISFMETQTTLLYTKAKGASEVAKNMNAVNSADQVGSVVDVVKSQIIGDVESSKWLTMFNMETQNENLNTNVLQQITQATNAFMGVNVGNTGGFNVGSAITAGMVAAASYYGAAAMEAKAATSAGDMNTTLGIT